MNREEKNLTIFSIIVYAFVVMITIGRKRYDILIGVTVAIVLAFLINRYYYKKKKPYFP